LLLFSDPPFHHVQTYANRRTKSTAGLKKMEGSLECFVGAELRQCSIGIQSIKREPFLPFLKAYPSLDKIRVVRSSSPFACKLLLFFFMSLLIQRMVFLALRLFLCCPAILMFKYF
jgi:hypothetical protein